MISKSERLKNAVKLLLRVDLEVMRTSMVDDQEEIALLTELKGAVDDLRDSIWCRMQLKCNSKAEACRMVESHRMNRVVQMLRKVRQTHETAPQVALGLGRIEAIAEAAVTEHRVDRRVQKLFPPPAIGIGSESLANHRTAIAVGN